MAKASVELGSRGTTVNETLGAIPSDDFADPLSGGAASARAAR